MGWYAIAQALKKGTGPYATVREAMNGESSPVSSLLVACVEVRAQIYAGAYFPDKKARARLSVWCRRVRIQILYPYMIYSRDGGPLENGASLVFARNIREARAVGWKGVGGEIADNEFTNLKAELMEAPWIYKDANQNYLREGRAHEIESPTSCKSCENWGRELGPDGICSECSEDIKFAVSVKHLKEGE